jgi:LacI family transcriptional regulator
MSVVKFLLLRTYFIVFRQDRLALDKWSACEYLIASMATMKDVADRARVSQATASHVINEKTYVSPKLRERVLRAIRDLNYHPNAVARTLRTKRSKTIGMIIPNISDPFFDSVVRGAEDVLANEGYALIVGNSDDDLRKEETYYRTFRAKQVDGMLLIISPGGGPPEYLQRHVPEMAPIVYLDRYYRGLRGDTVLLDDFGGSYQGVGHLLSLGHRRIAMITGPLNLANASMRLQGFRQALADHGVPFDDSLIREGRFDMNSGEEKAGEILQLNPRPTALFASNALMAVGAFRAFTKGGIRCPRDIALVSYNDFEWFDLLKPSITAVRQPVYDLGATAAEILLKRISGKLTSSYRRVILKSELVIRESCGSPRPPSTVTEVTENRLPNAAGTSRGETSTGANSADAEVPVE